MTKHIELKAVNQGTALATGTLALPPLVIEGLEEFKGSFDRLCLRAGTAAIEACRTPLWQALRAGSRAVAASRRTQAFLAVRAHLDPALLERASFRSCANDSDI
jgi:hypothetical protein